MKWEQVGIAITLAAKEWFIIHSVKRQHRPEKIRRRFDAGEYPAQPGSIAGTRTFDFPIKDEGGGMSDEEVDQGFENLRLRMGATPKEIELENEIARLRATLEKVLSDWQLEREQNRRLRAEVERLNIDLRHADETAAMSEQRCNEALAQVAIAMQALEEAAGIDERHHFDEWWKKWADPIANGEEMAHDKARALLTRLERAERVAEAMQERQRIHGNGALTGHEREALTTWQEARDAH